jgi:hypothetical protein
VTDLQIEPIARVLLGAPNKHLSKPTELRYGTHGSLKIDLNKNAWFDHEANCGGGVLDLVNREIGGDHSDARQWLSDNGLEARPMAMLREPGGVSWIRTTTATNTASCCFRQSATSLRGSANGGRMRMGGPGTLRAFAVYLSACLTCRKQSLPRGWWSLSRAKKMSMPCAAWAFRLPHAPGGW